MRSPLAAALGVVLGSSATLALTWASADVGPAPACEPALAAATTAARPARLAGDPALAADARAPAASHHAALRRELTAQTAQTSELRSALTRAEQDQADSKTYDLSAEKLLDLAARCELRWDMPSLGPQPPSVTAGAIRALDLSEDERRAANEVFHSAHRRLLDLVEKTYAEALGRDPAETHLSGVAMLEEIIDKTDRGELQAIFQRLARERAGLDAPRAARPSPIEALLRAMTSTGNELEARLAGRLEADRARQLRDLNRGWDSQHRSSYGCPP